MQVTEMIAITVPYTVCGRENCHSERLILVRETEDGIGGESAHGSES